MIRQKPDYNRVLKKSSNITKMFLKEFSDLKSNNDHSVLILLTQHIPFMFPVGKWEKKIKRNPVILKDPRKNV